MSIRNKKQLNKLINQAVKACFKDGKLLEEKVKSFVNTFKKFPQGLSIQVLTIFVNKLKIEVEKTTLEIKSSSALSKDEKEEVFKSFKKNYPITNTINIIDPNLIAGIQVRVFDNIVDLSLLNRIKQIGEVIHE